MAAARNALADGKLDPTTYPNPERFGCIIGSGIGGLKSLSDQHTILMNKGPGRISPFMIPMMISNMASGFVSMEFGLQGPNFADRLRLRNRLPRDRRGVAHDPV